MREDAFEAEIVRRGGHPVRTVLAETHPVPRSPAFKDEVSARSSYDLKESALEDIHPKGTAQFLETDSCSGCLTTYFDFANPAGLVGDRHTQIGDRTDPDP